MGKGKYLSDAEKAVIRICKDNGYSNRKTATEIGRSEGVIRNFLKKGEKYGHKTSTRGNAKLTNRQKGQIRFEATKNRLSADQIKNKLDLPVTKQHVAHVLRRSEHIRYKKLKGKPRLTKCHKDNRLKFARKYMQFKEEWKKTIFSDEKKFNLDGPDRYSCYWHDLRHKNTCRSKRNFGGGSVMVWGAFSDKGKLPLCFIGNRMDSMAYNKLLSDNLLPYVEEFFDAGFIFQQDNASIHVSKRSREWFTENSIPLLDWPACSPDCNPMENLWGILASKVYESGRQFQSILELKHCIQESWDEIDTGIPQRLVDSMPNRIFEVISHNGGHTKY